MSEEKTAEALFPTQAQIDHKPLPDVDLKIGAPYAPLARSFYRVPKKLQVCQELPSEKELYNILDLRKKFNIGDYQTPYVADIARAFRLLHGARAYLEIGTFDRGNLAYLSTILADDALIIGLDVVDVEVQDDLLRGVLKRGQTYVPVVGSSRDQETVARVASVLGDRQLDGVFIDGDHTAFGVMSDYARYESFVSDAGVILFHDSVWEGDHQYKGSADALAEIDRVDPVYLIDGENPVRRFIRPLWRNSFWGVVGVVFAGDQAWRRL
ncbi:class I SAM-dependent methyltransferase [Methylorubrum extorquens]